LSSSPDAALVGGIHPAGGLALEGVPELGQVAEHVVDPLGMAGMLAQTGRRAGQTTPVLGKGHEEGPQVLGAIPPAIGVEGQA